MKSTNLILDACSVINLINCNQLENCSNIPNLTFYIGYSAYDEVCKIESQKAVLDDLIGQGTIILFENDIEIDTLSELYKKYTLGDGETEAIAIAMHNYMMVCCDDRKARNAAAKELGRNEVVGSLTLLKNAVNASIIKCTNAFDSYVDMKDKGGFLPNSIDNHFFCKAS